MGEREYTDDRVPMTDTPDYPDTYSDYTEESADQLVDELMELLNEEEGIVSENRILEEGVVYDNEMALENMENDYSDMYEEK